MYSVITYADREYTIGSSVDIIVHVFEAGRYAADAKVDVTVGTDYFNPHKVNVSEQGTGQWKGTFTIEERDVTSFGDLSFSGWVPVMALISKGSADESAYASIDLNLPPWFTDADLGVYWRAMSDAWAALGVAVVTGHTGRHEGLGGTLVGAATLIGVGDEGRYVSPGMARPGDQVILTKGCAIETAAVAAWLAPVRLRHHVDDDGLAYLRCGRCWKHGSKRSAWRRKWFRRRPVSRWRTRGGARCNWIRWSER